jgi:prepilin-type processing-associated H-X9-DG protein
MRITIGITGIVLCLLVAPAPVVAHHAFAAEFDINTPVNLQGRVTMMEWVNPHAWIHLDVTLANGEVESWMVEGGSPNILLRRGFTKDSLLPGTEIAVEGYRAKNGLNRANGANITFADGRRLFLGGSNPDNPSN